MHTCSSLLGDSMPAIMKPVVSPRRTLRTSTCCVELLALSFSVKGFPTVKNGGQLLVTCSRKIRTWYIHRRQPILMPGRLLACCGTVLCRHRIRCARVRAHLQGS